ncbi:MAG: lytic murein transglycosylase [Pseudomonadota bacterium]|nr:lytic murein transglycosylase [Pseudomonadota bacterium]
MKRTGWAAALAVGMALATPALAARCGRGADGFDEWLGGFKQEAASAGISRSVIDSALGDVSYDDNVISHDRGQRAFGQSFATFSSRHITAFGLKKGKSMMQRYAEPLQSIERRYGVPGAVLVAIWGLETGYGTVTGKFETFSALATLAYDCRRTDKFHEELIAALKIVQRGDLSPGEMRGAWAGEIGQTQFMPTSYLKYGSGDLIHNPIDALTSTANYLHAHGWQKGAGWDEGQANFAALLEWNAASVYAKTIALFADKLNGSGGADSE